MACILDTEERGKNGGLFLATGFMLIVFSLPQCFKKVFIGKDRNLVYLSHRGSRLTQRNLFKPFSSEQGFERFSYPVLHNTPSL